MGSEGEYDNKTGWTVIDCVSQINETCTTIPTDRDLPDYTDGLEMERIISIVVPILFGMVVIIGLIGNALVVVVVACNRQMRNTTNILIINLAMADLLFITFCVPFTATDYALAEWPFGNIWCKVVQYFLHVCAYASVYTLVLMSLDRFLAVVVPVASMSIRTERNTYMAIVVVWSVIVVSCFPVYMSHGRFEYTYALEQHSACTFLPTEAYNLMAFQISFFLTSYVIPLALICVLYLFMLNRLWHGVNPGGHVSIESIRGKKRVTRLVIIVVIIFAACWAPVQIVLVLKSVHHYELNPRNIVIQITSQVLAYSNSCVNPILYAFLSENFRKAFRKLIACHDKRPPNSRCINGERSETRCMITGTSKLTNNDIDII